MYSLNIQIDLKGLNSFEVSGNIISFECSENSRDASLTLMPGVIEQEAKVVIYDFQGQFRNYAMRYDVDVFQGAGVLITYEDEDGEQTLGAYIVEQVDIEGDSNEVTIRCTDATRKLSDIKINQYPVDTKTGHELLSLLFENYLGISEAGWSYENSKVNFVCNNAVISNFFMNKTDAREVLDQLCYALMLHIYYDCGIYKVGLSV